MEIKSQYIEQIWLTRFDEIPMSKLFIGPNQSKLIERFAFQDVNLQRDPAGNLRIQCDVGVGKTSNGTQVIRKLILEARKIILGVEGYAAEFIKQAKGGICIEPENAEQLAESVEHLADNPHLCKSLGQSGYEYVTKYYNRDQLANKYIEMITLIKNPEIQKAAI